LLSKKKLPPEHFHRTDWIRDQLALNTHFACCSASAWSDWKIAWTRASVADRSRYAEMSDSTIAIAAAHRASQAIVPVQPSGARDHALTPFNWNCNSAPLEMMLATGSKFLLHCQSGSITSWGSQLDVGLSAVQCRRPVDTSIISAILFAKRSALPELLRRRIEKASLHCMPSIDAASQFFTKCSRQMPKEDAESIHPGKKFKVNKAHNLNPQTTTDRVLDMRLQLLATFAVIARLGGKPRGVAGRDVFLALHRGIDTHDQAHALPLFLHLSDAKDQSGGTPAMQVLTEYQHVRTDFAKLEAHGLDHLFCNGMIIAPRHETFVESWGDRHPHPFGELTHAPVQTFDSDLLACELASQYDRVVVHLLSSELAFESPHGFCRFITGTSRSWEVLAFAPVNISIEDDTSLDLLEDHPNGQHASVEVDELDPDQEVQAASGDDFARWLEAAMIEHGQHSEPASAELLGLVRDALNEEAYEAPIEEAQSHELEPPAVPELSYVHLLLSLGLLQDDSIGNRTNFKFVSNSDNAGYIQRFGHTQVNLKATCLQNHDKCVCWLQPRGCTDDQVWRALVKWLAQGACSSADHAEAAFAIKRSFGMKPRRKA
jgi:hypothetical protein